VELRDVEYFAVVAEHGHLGRAAAALGISQPALSKSLRRLETVLAVKLVKRTVKGVELTPEGSILQQRVRDLRLSLQNVTREIKEVSEGRVAHLRVGVGGAMPELLLSAAFGKLLQDAPRTNLKISVSDNDVMIPALRNGELDLIVNYSWTRDPKGVVFEPLYQDDHVICAAASHRLAGKAKVTLRDLVDERWACSEPGLLPQQRLREVFRDAGLPPPCIALECRSTALRLRSVVNSDLLDLTSESVVRQLAGLAVKVLPVKELTWRRSIGVIRRDETYLPPAARRFIEIVKAVARDISASR
jgi:DNA-binding transcriptional LysR family regulator